LLIIIRQTQWDPPTWDALAEDLAEKKQGEMDLSTSKGINKKVSFRFGFFDHSIKSNSSNMLGP